MSRKIKFHTFNFLYRLFAYLADKSGGWRVFVRPKLLLGSLIVGLGWTACNGKINTTKDSSQSSSKNPVNTVNFKDSIKNKSILQTNSLNSTVRFVKPIVSCYDTEIIEPDSIVVDSNYVYQVVEQMPRFSTGDDSLLIHISKNLKWPDTDSDVQGKVIVRFVVNTDGSISNIEILRSLESHFDSEAIRVIKTLPKFIPGKQNGHPVRVYFTLPITFKLV